MSSGRQPPIGTPQLATHAGLTPQMSIVDANGRPTMFFFRWLLTIGGAALTSADNSILESFDPGADAALTESALADTLDAAQLAALTESAITESAIRDTLETARIAAGFDDGNAARADSTARIDDLALLYALRSGGRGTGPRSDQRALEAFLMADAPQTPATPVTFLADTLANWTLANYNPANYANGQQFIVTTWQVTYAVEAGVWRYVAGVFIALAVSRPTTAFNGAALGAADTGLRFLASDTGVSQYWNGAAWVPIGGSATPSGPAGGDLGGTYPNPTVVKAAGNFAVAGATTFNGSMLQNDTGGGAYYVLRAASVAGVQMQIQSTQVAQFLAYEGNTLLDYQGALSLRSFSGAGNQVTFDANANVTISQLLTLTPRAVGSLPAATVGSIACVNNALSPVAGSAVAGGGAANALVWWNGAHWTVFAV